MLKTKILLFVKLVKWEVRGMLAVEAENTMVAEEAVAATVTVSVAAVAVSEGKSNESTKKTKKICVCRTYMCHSTYC